MELKMPAYYRVFSGTLDQGIFTDKAFESEGGFFPTEYMTYDVDFSGRNVAVLLKLSHEHGCYPDKTVTGLDSASIRYSQCAGVDFHHHWGRLSLEKLKNEKGITLVDSKPRMVTTVGDIRYQERLDSFFKEASPGEVVHPLFAEKGKFDPETLAADGWEYAPPVFDSKKEAGSSWQYFIIKKYADHDADGFLLESTTHDAIKTYDRLGAYKFFNLSDNNMFPNGLVIENDECADYYNSLVNDLKRNYGFSLLSDGKQSHKAVGVKLAGCHDFLLTTLENEDKLNFEPFSDHDLLSYFRDSWQEHIEQIDSKEFEQNTLPTLEKILPAIDENYKVIVDCIEMICGMGHSMVAVFEASNINQELIKDKMIQFQLLYRELVLIQKQIEFYEVVEKVARQISEGLIEDICSRYLTPLRIKVAQAEAGSIGQDELVCLFKKWFASFNRKENKKAISKLKVLRRKLFIVKCKVGMQSVLEDMLINLTGKLLGLKYSSHDEIMRNDCHRRFTITNEVLVLIGLNKPALNRSCNRSLEPLDLADNLTSLPLEQKDRTLSAPR